MRELIIGGTSGLGLEMAILGAQEGKEVTVTGRHDPEVNLVNYEPFELTAPDLPGRIGALVMRLPEVNSLVYAAGFFQEGCITDLDDNQIEAMVDVGGRGLIYFVREILRKQGRLDEIVTITSTSQWVPREKEPIYNFVKAGAAHLSHGLSLDKRIGKVLVAGPSGMATPFWEGLSKDTSKMMDPIWAANEINKLRRSTYSYRFTKILGASGDLPQRVEIIETT